MAVWLSMDMSYVGPGDTADKSKVAVSVTVHWSSVSYNGYSPPVTVSIDGASDTEYVSFNTNKTSSGSQTIYYKYWDLGYDSSGSARTAYGSASYETGTGSGTVTASASVSLPAIGGSGGSSGGDSGGDSGDSGGDTGGSGSDDESGSDILVHPDTNCTYLGTSSTGVVYGNLGLYKNRLSGQWYIKFKTPSNLVSSNSVTVRLTNYGVYWNEYDNSYNITFMLWEGTPDNSEGYLTWVSGLPSELNTSHSSYDVVIPTTELKPDTEYVIEVTSAAVSNFVEADAPVGIIIDYVAAPKQEKPCYISGDPYTINIEDGTNWYEYEAYIDNGTGWDLY